MKYLAAIFAVAFVLSGCESDDKAAALRKNPEVSSIGEIDGCQVKYVNRGWSVDSFFIARCGSAPTTTTTQNYSTTDKSHSPRRSAVIEVEMKKLQEEKDAADAKEKALAKLSPEERKTLGIE
jgi:hypothetical protein